MIDPTPDPVFDALVAKLETVMAAALPTSRHACVLFDAVVDLLGASADVLAWDEGRHRALFLRDSRRADWLIPWPIVELALGKRLRGTFEIGGDVFVVRREELTRPPVRMAGLCRGQIAFGEPPVAMQAEFSDEGMRVQPDTGTGLVEVAAPSGGHDVVARLVNDFDGTGAAVERLAARVARLDPGRHAGRVGWYPEDGGHRPDGRWLGCWRLLRRALWLGEAPTSTCWLFTDPQDGTVHHSDLATPPAYPGAVVAVEAERAVDAVPSGWRDRGFTRWARVLGAVGQVDHVLVRGALPAPVTLVGEQLATALDPSTFDAWLDWFHIERGELPLSAGWLPPRNVRPELAELEGLPLQTEDHAVTVYGPGTGGSAHLDQWGWNDGSQLSWLDTVSLAHRVVHIARG